MRALLIGLLLLLVMPCRVLAQPSQALTPAQARAALDVLNDPQKRAQVTTTLEAIAKAQPAPTQPTASPPQATPPATPPPTSAKPAGLPLAPNSLGAEVLVGAETFLNHLSTETTNGLHAIRSLPLLWGWMVVMATNPGARSFLLDVAWRVAVALLCGLAVEWVLRRLIRRPIATLEAWAPTNGHPDEPDDEPAEEAANQQHAASEEDQEETASTAAPTSQAQGEDAVERAEAGETEPPQRRRLRLPPLVLLRRVPLVLARLALDLIPVVSFVLVGHVVAATDIGGQPIGRLVMLAVVDSYALCVALLSVAHALLSPETARLRLFSLPEGLAAYLMRWTRRLIIIAVSGYAIGEVGLLLGLSDVAHGGVQKTTGFVLHACLAIIVLEKRRAVRQRLRAPPGATGAMARLRNSLASVWHWIALFLIIGGWLVYAVEIPDGFVRLLHFCIITALLLIGGRLLLIVLTGSLDRALSVPAAAAARYPGLEARLRLYHPALSVLLRWLVYALCLLALLQLYGLGGFTWFTESDLGQRVVAALGTLVVTLLLALAAWEGTNAAIQRHLAKLAEDQQVARSARLRTLLPLMRSALMITILVVAGMMVLSQIGINIAPLLAGAGIIGVAIGFGSQKLVQDLITGIFLLLENAMQVGDTVTVSGLTGVVENLSVRTIRLRAGDGSVHIIPFSSVTTVNNVNRGLGNAPVNVTVAYEEDTDRVAKELSEVVADMRADPDYAGKMLSDFQLWGVDRVDGAGATIVGQVVCTDSGRWSVQREFNRRMKKRFQELGIQLYNPLRSVAVTLPQATPREEPHAEPPPGIAEQEQADERARAAE